MTPRRVFALSMLAVLILATMGVVATAGAPLAGPKLTAAWHGTSTNWAGYAIETNLTSPATGAVTDVKGSWIVPAVTCTGTNTWSAAWIGIDGYSSNSVEQTGTEQDCTNGGTTPVYSAWTEMYPKFPVTLNLAIHPGDAISAEVSFARGTFTLKLTDLTTGRSSTTSAKNNHDARSSAEWIMEAPWSGGVLPLADYGPMSFTGASATLNGHTGAINDGAWQFDRIDMVNGAGQVKSATGALDATGTSFSETWLRSS